MKRKKGNLTMWFCSLRLPVAVAVLASATFCAAASAAKAAAPPISTQPASAAAAAETGSLPVPPPGVSVERNVVYLAPERKERLDLYLPTSRPKNARSPAVVIIHGGGWSGGSKSAAREWNIGTTLAQAGYVCASIEYRLDKQNRWPTNVWDCKNAVRFLRKNAALYGVDTEHIGVIGGSAGGHLALMVGLATSDTAPQLSPPSPYPGVSDTVQVVVDMYGIANVRTGQQTDKAGNPTGAFKSWDSVFGDHTPITDADRKLASPVEHLRKNSPPVLILQGTSDTTVDRDQSKELDKKLTAAGVSHRLILIPGIGHTFDLQTWNRKPLPFDLRPIVVEWFNHYLKPTQTVGTHAK